MAVFGYERVLQGTKPVVSGDGTSIAPVIFFYHTAHLGHSGFQSTAPGRTVYTEIDVYLLFCSRFLRTKQSVQKTLFAAKALLIYTSPGVGRQARHGRRQDEGHERTKLTSDNNGNEWVPARARDQDLRTRAASGYSKKFAEAAGIKYTM